MLASYLVETLIPYCRLFCLPKCNFDFARNRVKTKSWLPKCNFDFARNNTASCISYMKKRKKKKRKRILWISINEIRKIRLLALSHTHMFRDFPPFNSNLTFIPIWNTRSKGFFFFFFFSINSKLYIHPNSSFTPLFSEIYAYSNHRNS